MELRSVLAHLLLILVSLVEECKGIGTLELQLVRYYYSSAGCGGTLWTDVCDFVFSVDATTEISRNGSLQPHKAVSFITKVYNDQQDINFTLGLDAFGIGLSNPIRIPFERPVINMSVSSVDVDTATWVWGASNTSVSDLSFSLNINSTAAGSTARIIRYSKGYLQLIYQVYCSANYAGDVCDKCAIDQYGSDCSVRCSNNANYTCNTTTGARICSANRAPPDCTTCSPNLFGAFCNVSCVPTPRSGCASNGTVVCLGNRVGQRCLSCLPSYYSADCSVHCIPGPGWICGTDGVRKCNTGWSGTDCLNCATGLYGSQCDIQCSPVRGRYNCSNNGTKQCLPRWDGSECDMCLPGYYGNNCTTYCVNTRQYRCDTNGTRVCMVGWDGPNCSTCSQNYYGVNCDIKCVPKPGIYRCDSSGIKRCQGNRNGIECGGCAEGWFGVECDVHCVPEKRFGCDAKGGRVCRYYWTGVNCSRCTVGRIGPECGSCAPNYYDEECKTFCEDTDSVAGHYVCAARGNKLCMSGWVGSETNCTLRDLDIDIGQLDPSRITQSNIKSLTSSAIMITVASLSIFFLIIVIFWAVKRKQRRREERKNKQKNNKGTNKKEKIEEKMKENSQCVDEEDVKITEMDVILDGYNFYYSNPVYVDEDF